ncbi:MAG: hypothetical protein KC422_22700 [Trueperaceae bacterium]|nr:hypothetical protein [Trueperaceae bacterium]
MKLDVKPHPSVAFYKTLVYLYPKAYRQEYGSHMVQVFADLLHDASRNGARSVMQVWAIALLDLVKTVIEEYARGGIRMTKSSFTLLSSFLLMLGGLFWLPVSYGQFEQYWEDPFGGPDILFEIGQKFMGPAMLLVALGLLGFVLHYGSRLSSLIKANLIISNSIIGTMAVLGIAGDLMLLPKTWEWAWYFFIVGMIIHLTGIIILGICALRCQLLTRFNVAFLLIGLPFPIYMFVGLIVQLMHITPSSALNDGFSAASLAAMGLGWILIGYAFFKDQIMIKKLQPSL